MKNEMTDSLLQGQGQHRLFPSMIQPREATTLYHPMTLNPGLPFERHEADSGRNSGKAHPICPKFHAPSRRTRTGRTTSSSAYYEHRTRRIMTIITRMIVVAITKTVMVTIIWNYKVVRIVIVTIMVWSTGHGCQYFY